MNICILSKFAFAVFCSFNYSHLLPPVGAAVPETSKGKQYRRADTNIVSIKFSQLIKPSDMHTGDAVYCNSCNAVLSQLSKITHQYEDKVISYKSIFYIICITFYLPVFINKPMLKIVITFL